MWTDNPISCDANEIKMKKQNNQKLIIIEYILSNKYSKVEDDYKFFN